MSDKPFFSILLVLALSLFAACSQDDALPDLSGGETDVRLHISMSPFDGELPLRTSVAGDQWEAGDKFRMKIICPYTSDHQLGESWSSAFHELTITDASPFVASLGVQSQATTYIYTAQNTTGTRIFVFDNYRYSRPSNFFCADQSTAENFKKSDVLWAQGVRQTGAQEVHLNFRHKVAKLRVTVDASQLSAPLTSAAVLTLEGMPDIDGAEIVVGDYYAPMGYESQKFSYREKASCGYALNGKVLGVEVIAEGDAAVYGQGKGRSSIATLSGGPTDLGETQYARIWGPIPNTATYTCHRPSPEANEFLLYVPPCVLPVAPVFWLRDGERRYRIAFAQQEFAEGCAYSVMLKPAEPAPAEPNP